MGQLITLQDLALEGLSGQDARLEHLITGAEAYIQQVTGFRFYQHEATFVLDGPGFDTLILPQPVIALTSVTEDGVALSASDYTVYNRRPPAPDDRLFPRLVKANNSLLTAGWQGSLPTEPVWNRGRQNITIVGTFGFTDLIGDDEVTPWEIRRAAVRLVKLLEYRVGSDDEMAALRVVKYGTDINTAGVRVMVNDRAIGDISGDEVADSILTRYTHTQRGARSKFAFGGA